MCGRYSFAPKLKQIEEDLSNVVLPAQLEIKYNIAPTQSAYVITGDNPLALQKMEWGLVPYWSKDGKNTGKLINARLETIDEKPSFREPFTNRHCLVPADSFYEWRREPNNRKIPFRIFNKDNRILFMAGIWDEWKDAGQIKRTFSIITCSPNKEMAEIHNRMPVILADQVAQMDWLKQKGDMVHLEPLKDGTLDMYQVSDALNKAGTDSPTFHKPVPEQWRLF
ncbi:MAG: SOS response-associated peptidase [Saprospiraceae bacterium]